MAEDTTVATRPRPSLSGLRGLVIPAFPGRTAIGGLAVAALLAAVPTVVHTAYQLKNLDLILVYAIAAMTLNFAYGFGGQLALGQPVLLGVGSYTAALLSIHLHLGLWLTAVPAAAAAVLTSLVLGLPSLRVRGWYFAVLTFFGVAVFPDVISAFRSYTGGDNGLIGVSPITVGGQLLSQAQAYEIYLALALVTWWVIRLLVRSHWGTVLQSLRDHPTATESCGVKLTHVKTWTYVILAIPCGLAGAVFAHNSQFVAPTSFDFSTLLLLIGAVFIGGKGTLMGPVIGICLFRGISQLIGPFSEYNSLFLGVGVLLSAVVFRGGIVPRLNALCAWLLPNAWRRPDRDLAVEPAPAPPDRRTDRQTLAVRDLHKSFGGNHVLRGVTFELRAGTVLGVVGPNGSGKTTLLNVISGFLHPDRGSVRLGTREVTGRRAAELAKLGLSRTFQVPKLVGSLSVRRNIGLGVVGLGQHRDATTHHDATRHHDATAHRDGRRHRWRGRTQRHDARVRRSVSLVGLAGQDLEAPSATLSLGLKRMAEVARAVACDARLICLDEPAAGLNLDEQAKLAQAIRYLADSGCAVLLIEHNPDFVRGVCDDILLLENGEVVAQGSSADPEGVHPAIESFFSAFHLTVGVSR